MSGKQVLTPESSEGELTDDEGTKVMHLKLDTISD